MGNLLLVADLFFSAEKTSINPKYLGPFGCKNGDDDNNNNNSSYIMDLYLERGRH